MEQQRENKLQCQVCHKTFSSVSAKNLHLKNFHNIISLPKNKHIKCPLCPEDNKEPFNTFKNLLQHLRQFHTVAINEIDLSFGTVEEFETWRKQANREIDYTRTRNEKISNNARLYVYDCNRSDTKGLGSKCTERQMKKGGSIKIAGMCPSRIQATISSSNVVSVHFIETHVGHENELRSKRLTEKEQEMLASKLTEGVTVDRILKDSRNTQNSELTRMNILTRGDLAYLIRKFNIDKKRHEDDMIATTMKVEEWNNREENQVFLFKKIGERHPELKEEDFALGYMNKMMEKKMKEFHKIICIDGTHGTNRKNWDLTIVLVKDERNIGFPVAFLLSNRLDQVIQKVFFSAMKNKLGGTIEAEYIMTDDDVKYYNAWVQVMALENKPRRLLCTWHVMKNWNIQGRAKLKKKENKQVMKKEMRRILTEIDPSTFMELKSKYFENLVDEGEIEFLNYLQKYYFQTEDRVKMWAHCFRKNCGINTNMAIESLNNVLKYHKLKGRQNIRVEKLLDMLEELVNDKMWKKIIETERPTANSYQHRVIKEAHDKAEKVVQHMITQLDDGDFQVQSSTEEGIFYRVSLNELCDEACRAVYCDTCKICIHRFQCECKEYTIRTALCKHIHAVALIRGRRDSVLGADSGDSDNFNLCISEPSTSKVNYQNEVHDFLEEQEKNHNGNISIDENKKHEIMLENVYNKLKNDYAALCEVNEFLLSREKSTATNTCRKRKIEKQLYYPSKK